MSDTTTDPRIAVLEEIARGSKAAFDRIDRQFDRLDQRFDRIDHRFERIDQRLDTIVTEQRSDYRWLLGIMLGGFGMMLTAYLGLLGVMARGFHWL